MFKKVDNKVSFPQLEKDILTLWKERRIFQKVSEDVERPLFTFYEGPPTANGSPGIHHVLARVFKDIICRYKTMKGYRPMRKGGWDTHGLPVELEIERELGLKSKREIEEYGIERFNQRCKDSVFQYVKEWETLTDRIGYWIDMTDPYVTLDRSYIETSWWILKQFWDRDLIYKGMKGTPHCPRCVSSLSSHEVALGYREETPDPSIYVKFQIHWTSPEAMKLWDAYINESGVDQTKCYFLAWTTTPWTLPGNSGLAVNADADYDIVKVEGGAQSQSEWLILAKLLREKVLKTEGSVIATVKGHELFGITYEKLYDPAKYDTEIRIFLRSDDSSSESTDLVPAQEFTPHVIVGSFVSLEDGTGIVHTAPAFGDEDLTAGRQAGLAFIQPVDLQGTITGSYPFAGKFVKDADEDIMNDLAERGILYRREVCKHTYPFCWRCSTPLLYYAKESWYIRTTALKDRLIVGNQNINWYPSHIKEGRFGEWLRGGVDWAISRERYWGTPIPIWQCQTCGTHHCIGTMDELKQMAVPKHQSLIDNLDPHKPYVDEILIQCPQCDGQMKRIPEVLDAWFDSGAMPFAQWNVTSEQEIQKLRDHNRFPADYICEAVDQTRGWFYSLLAISTLLTDEPSYKNVICLGLILDEKGHKMSKSQGNVINPWEVLDTQGADATRWYLFTATHPGESRRFSQNLVNEVVRRFILTLWNVYSFFITYAQIDGYDPAQAADSEDTSSELDRWILSELNNLITQVDSYLENYDPTNGGRRIQEFVDLLSNWYVRRSRRRFWKSGNDQDKLSAYSTLYTCLSTLSKLMAPYTPFLSEEIYQNLEMALNREAPESVHLAAFPTADASLVDQPLMQSTRLAMRISSLGRDARSRAGKKVRLPLQRALVKTREALEEKYIDGIRDQVIEELNVKQLDILSDDSDFYKKVVELAGTGKSVQLEGYQVVMDGGYMVAVDTRITPELAEEGLARELVHRIQSLRKSAGFEVTDRILISWQGPETVERVMTRFSAYIREETLSDEILKDLPTDDFHAESQQLDGMETVLGVKLLK